MERLGRDFFDRDTVTVARELLGKPVVRILPDGRQVTGIITETEAYIGRMDKACHAYNYRRTARTETLFAPPGTAYVYLIYGMHHCLNFVTEPEGEPSAVLIRGISPLENGDIIAENRFGRKRADMTAYQRKHFLNGPGKVWLQSMPLCATAEALLPYLPTGGDGGSSGSGINIKLGGNG